MEGVFVKYVGGIYILEGEISFMWYEWMRDKKDYKSLVGWFEVNKEFWKYKMEKICFDSIVCETFLGFSFL